MSSLLGKTVLYTLNDQDVQQIEQLVPRLNAAAQLTMNPPRVGDPCPALVVRDNGGSVNLKVQLDGGADAVLWVTSRLEGDELGQWQKR